MTFSKFIFSEIFKQILFLIKYYTLFHFNSSVNEITIKIFYIW